MAVLHRFECTVYTHDIIPLITGQGRISKVQKGVRWLSGKVLGHPKKMVCCHLTHIFPGGYVGRHFFH